VEVLLLVGKKRKQASQIGLPPGTAVYVGERKPEKTRIWVIDYDKERYVAKELEEVEECVKYKESPAMTWIRVVGLHQVDILERLGRCLGLHPLVIEDLLNTTQRPKIEDLGEYLFIVIKNAAYDEKTREVVSQQISIILGSNLVVSLQETEETIFGPILERIQNKRGNIRQMHSDYLAYTLLDAIVDNYFHVIEKFSTKIEILEDELVEDPTQQTLNEIHRLKRDMIVLRRSIWPIREVISHLDRGQFRLVNENIRIYIRDLYDHTIQVMETVETYRDMLSGMLDIYLSSVSNRMNEVMKVLTVITTIFIPLSLIAGIYGMNFQFMPELGMPWSYPVVIIVMLVIAVLMIAMFRQKKWL
jgi:magnesium transporter